MTTGHYIYLTHWHYSNVLKCMRFAQMDYYIIV